MKKIYSLITIGFIALFSLSLTSCNNDDYDAWLLDGYWEGTATSVGWRSETFNYVDFYFRKGSSYGKGIGYERDYNAFGELVAESRFAYEVVNGSIKLVYESPRVVVWIDSWRVYDNDSKLDAVFRYNSNTVRLYLDRRSGWRY
ncbi:MAG: hypothetical protein IKO28_06535 [Prevotella sp.]|nr:hypothetical protein [Prevotella sp.]